MAKEKEKHEEVVGALLGRFGRTYAEEAGITLADTPAPLYQLLVLTSLLSHRISADIAVTGAAALFGAGLRTPEKMREATWQQRVDALGKGNFRRYDESTSTTLGEVAEVVVERWKGDLRRLRDEADSDPARVSELLQEFKGIGPTGADIFRREVQAVWPGVSPFIDAKALDGARVLALPTDPDELAALAGPDRIARLASALVRVSLDPGSAADIT